MTIQFIIWTRNSPLRKFEINITVFFKKHDAEWECIFLNKLLLQNSDSLYTCIGDIARYGHWLACAQVLETSRYGQWLACSQVFETYQDMIISWHMQRYWRQQDMALAGLCRGTGDSKIWPLAGLCRGTGDSKIWH
jgi:hypothetical protein